MNFSKPTYNGIDIPIQGFQTYLYSSLKNLWKITNDVDLDMHGRCRKHEDADGVTPRIYVGNSDFKDVYFDDTKLCGLAFFGVQDSIKYQRPSAIADVFLIFMVNLKYSGFPTDDDEYIRTQVQQKASRYLGWTLTGMVTSKDQVFKEYSGWGKTTGIKYRDSYPLHCFRLDFQVAYDINNCQPSSNSFFNNKI